jgi:hypothetical protein
MTTWHRRPWLVSLGLGYLLLYGVLIAETAYAVFNMQVDSDPKYAAGALRAGWLAWWLNNAPIRALAEAATPRESLISLALFIPAALLLAVGYFFALRAVQRDPEAWTLRRLLGISALAALPLLLLVPLTSNDYVTYLFAGRAVSVYHLSPWHHPLSAFPAEHGYISTAEWGPDLKCVYGPVWVAVMALVTGVSHLLAPGEITSWSLLLNLFLLRVANIAAFAAAALAVWRIHGLLWPRQQRLVTAAFLLNPLLVYEALGALHNDIWGVAFLLWACYLFLRDDARLLVPLALSILTKYVILAMTPFLAVYYARRRDWLRMAGLIATVLVCIGITQLTAMDYLGARLAASSQKIFLTPTSTPEFIAILITLARDLPAIYVSTVQTASRCLLILFGLLYLTLLCRTRTREQVIDHSQWMVALYFAGVYVDTWQWYYVWPVGLLCAVRWTRARANLAFASCAILFAYVAHFWAHGGRYGHQPWVLLVGYVLGIGIPCLVCLAGRLGWWQACPAPCDVEPEPPAPDTRAPARQHRPVGAR